MTELHECTSLKPAADKIIVSKQTLQFQIKWISVVTTILATVNINTSVSRNKQRQNASTIIMTQNECQKDTTKNCVYIETNVLTKTKILLNLGILIKLSPCIMKLKECKQKPINSKKSVSHWRLT